VDSLAPCVTALLGTSDDPPPRRLTMRYRTSPPRPRPPPPSAIGAPRPRPLRSSTPPTSTP